MSGLKDTIDKIKSMEEEKASLLAEIEDLKRRADAKADALANEIAALREEVKSFKALMGQEKPQLPSDEYLKEKNLISVRELADKTIDATNQLGNQVFASSPFSQNFDSWLSNLRQIISDFESNSSVKMDEQFHKDRSQIFLDVEGALAQKRLEESNIGTVAKALADNNHLLVETDKEYAEKARELSLKRESEVERLTNRVHELERLVQSQEEDNRRKILRRKTEDKLPQTKQDLKSAKSELETAQQSFTAEQDKLHDDYVKNKQDIEGQVETLRKELEKIETDTSLEARQAACKALANAVNALVQRGYSPGTTAGTDTLQAEKR